MSQDLSHDPAAAGLRPGTPADPGAIPLRVVNIAPRKGDFIIGHVPYGLSGLRGFNMAGKSRVLAALEAIALERLEPGMMSIVDGEREGLVSLGTAELRVEERMLAGKMRRDVKRRGVEAEGAIERLPDPIEEMITGGNLQDAEARWRRRLRGLLAWHPLAVTEPYLTELVGPALPFPNHDLDVWLINAHNAKPYPTLLEAAEALAGPRGELNRRARITEETAAEVDREVARQDGVVEETRRSAAVAAGLDPAKAETERELLDDSPEMAGAPGAARAAELAHARLEVRAEARAAEEKRRERLREGQGARPEATEQEAELRSASLHAGEALQNWSERERTLKIQKLRTVSLQEGISAMNGDIDKFVDEVRANFEVVGAAIGVGAWFRGLQELELLSQKVQVLRESIEQQNTATAGLTAVSDEVLLAQLRFSEAAAALLLAEGRRDRADQALALAHQQQLTWDQTAALLAAPLEGPTAEQVTAAAANLALLQARAVLARAGAPFREARGKLAGLKDRHDQLVETAAQLRDETKRIWHRLGDLITTHLQSGIVRIQEGCIEVLHDDGRWLDVDDPQRLSAGRLRRAFLDFYLERCPAGQNILIDEKILLLVDYRGRCELSARAAAKQMRLLFEEPTSVEETTGDPHLVWYPATTPAPEGAK